MDVKLPKLGEGADSGVVVSVLVKEGDMVAKGQTVIELENEKAVAPVPSTAAGRVAKVRVKEGDKISVGHVLLVLEGGEPAVQPAPTTPSVKPRKAALVPVSEPEPGEVAEEAGEEAEPAGSDADVAAAPSLRVLARQLGIDWRKVRGSGRGGRIEQADLRAYIQRLTKLAAQPKVASTPSATSAPAVRTVESVDFSQWGEVTTKPLTQLRKVIARRMSESWQAVPRVTQFDEADITGLLELRKRHAEAYKAKGANLTVTCFALKAVVATLKKHPIFNASLDEAAQEVVFKNYFHLGMAVDTEQGLLVPVLRDVDKKSLLDLAKELAALAERARDRKISADEMKGGTFTISNQGAIGGGHFTPIVNLPEVAILGLGKGALKPAVVNGKIEPRTLLPIAISYDHRVIDGGTAARFTVDLAAALANFPENEVKL
ncbi:MAG: 2-oxo acid dehydrogenase subunit E2 [Verrucomicrobia bacterium]|nr:2-oxo acid dehydrogenase subunit E2 [Verrucomicrobiota bacterium]